MSSRRALNSNRPNTSTVDSNTNGVFGNFIGTDGNATVDLGNGRHGIEVHTSQGNQLGGLEENAGNVIAYNDGAGIVLSFVDFGEASLTYGNTILSNQIHSNGALGIAEARIMFDQQLAEESDPAKAAFIRQTRQQQIAKITEDAEEEKQRIRQA